MHRTCAEYTNENQTRNVRCGAALNVSPQQPASAAESRVFHLPQKLEVASYIAVQNLEVVYGTKIYLCKIASQSVLN